MSFAFNLKMLRTESGMKQQDLAEKINVSQKTISSWETGRTEPNMKELATLCKIFDCPIDQLTGTKSRNIGDISFEDIVVKIASLSVDELLTLSHLIDDTIKGKEHLELMLENEKKQRKQLEEYEKIIAELQAKYGEKE